MESLNVERSISIVGSLNEESLQKLAQQISLMYKSDKEKIINLFISSPGGIIDGTFGIYEFIKGLLQVKIHTFALGALNSMAPILFMLGEKRIIGTHSTVYFHEFGIIPGDKQRLTSSQLIREGKDLKMKESIYIKIISSTTGIPEKTLRHWMKIEKQLTSDECIKYGIAHEKIPS